MVSLAIVRFFDLALIQGWILYKKILEDDSMCMKNLKLSVADVQLMAGKGQQKKGTASQIQINADFNRKSKRHPAAPIRIRLFEETKLITGEKIVMQAFLDGMLPHKQFAQSAM